MNPDLTISDWPFGLSHHFKYLLSVFFPDVGAQVDVRRDHQLLDVYSGAPQEWGALARVAMNDGHSDLFYMAISGAQQGGSAAWYRETSCTKPFMCRRLDLSVAGTVRPDVTGTSGWPRHVWLWQASHDGYDRSPISVSHP